MAPRGGLRVGVAGGGIGGLSAAVSLVAAGFDAHVYERAAALGEIGAGVQVSPNATRILHGLGLAGELARTGVRPRALWQRRWDDGRVLLDAPTRDFGFPYYQMRRPDLLAALAGALPAGRVHLGRRLTGFDDHGDGVRASFADGSTAELDVLVGADGIHSVVHGALFGAARPRFTGCVAYRGLIPAERVRHLGLPVTTQLWLGPGRHFIHYFVGGGRFLNFVAIVEQDSWTRESWTDRADVAAARAAFDGWHPQIHQILGAIDQTYIWALFDRLPLPRWSRNRVTLLGDACHPMLPFMAQGAAQAIEDGAVLAGCLAGAGDPAGALRRYEALRRPRTSRIQAMSAENKIRFHLPDGDAQKARDEALARGGTNLSAPIVESIYSYDATRAADPQESGQVFR
ncbi:FAD-dependent monooxygenase [Actinoplanes sp. CA-030573]|uniref:FAD-dependent monooxygenase n=1 Tax=Actinoplanes sp. CA-030573 TaxID=3239898 RepID=UPI003D9455D6